MKPRITFELSQSLLEQIQRYAEENDMKIAAICRKATKEFTAAFRVVEPVAPAPKPATTAPDDDAVGADGYTKAQRKALYAEMNAREEARQALALPPHRELVQRQSTIDAWTDD